MNKSQRTSWSAERRVILVFGLSALAGIVLVGGALSYSLQRAALAQCRTNLEGRAGVLASHCDGEITEARRDLEFLAKTSTFQQLPHVDQIDVSINGAPENVDVEKRRLLTQLMNKAERFSVLYVLRTNADIYVLEPFRLQPKLTRHNLSDRPYYQEAVRTKAPVISDSFVGADGMLAVVILVPILADNGDVIGYLGGAFYLTRLSQLVSKERIRPFDAGFIVDRKGQLIAHTDAELLKEGPRERFIEQQPLAPSFLASMSSPAGAKPGEALYGECPGAGGAKHHLAAFVPLRSGWGLCLMRDRGAVLAEARPVIWGITSLVALLLAVVGGLGVGFAHRIGQRWNEAERALRESDEKYRALFESALDAIVVASAETGTIIDCNRAATLLWGREKSELVGQHQRILHPPEEEKGEFSRTFQEHLRDRKEQVIAAQIMTKNGEIRGVEIMANAFELDGQRLIQGMFRDITERRRAEEALARRADELAQFNAAAVGRELRMVELKEQVNELTRQLGQPPPYEMESLNEAVQTTAPGSEGGIIGIPRSQTTDHGSDA